MAAKIFSPLIARLRRRFQGERLRENDVIFLLRENDFSEVQQNGLSEKNTTDPTTEVNHVNAGSTSTANDYAIELQDGVDLARDRNRTALATNVKAPTRNRVAFLGIILAIIASLILSFGALMIKLAKSIPSLEVVFFRLTLQLIFSLPAMIFFKDKFIYPWKQTKYLLLRGATGTTAMTLMVYAVKHMPLADARVIFYTSPVFTAIFGRIFLKESVSKFDVIAMFLSIGGVVLIGRPTFLFGSLGKASSDNQVLVPTLLAVTSAIFMALSIILIRKMSQEVGTRVVVFYFPLVGSIISLAGSLISGFKYPDCGTHDAVYMLAVGALGYTGQMISTKALTMEKASVISLVRTIGVAFSFILQLIFLDVIPNGLSIGGAILVLLCNVTVFIKKFLDTKNRNLEQ
ncbi:hypothetical protein ACROYT_G035142 [Oculina patagonica]